jgi:hypothetical protein
MWDLGQDYAFYAELFKRKGDQVKVKETLLKAIEILKECGRMAGWRNMRKSWLQFLERNGSNIMQPSHQWFRLMIVYGLYQKQGRISWINYFNRPEFKGIKCY